MSSFYSSQNIVFKAEMTGSLVNKVIEGCAVEDLAQDESQ